jgi:hypothetical protein
MLTIMMKRLAGILWCLLVAVQVSQACQCPLTSLSQAELDKYDIIFKGKIDSVMLHGKKSIAVFTIDELYKGMVAKEFTLLFDDEDVCKLELRPGDEWIIYANYHQIDNAKLDFCSRSRKFIKNTKEDFFAETTGVSYDEELAFLLEKLGLHKVLKENPNKAAENRNILPSTNQMIIGFLCSLGGLFLFYWLFNRFFK